MGDRLQRILARQQERERAMRERELLKTPNATPQQPAPYVRPAAAPTKASADVTSSRGDVATEQRLDSQVGQSRWQKSEYGWMQLDESRGSASLISATSRESSSYVAPVTYTFLPTKDYELLNIGKALERPKDFRVACNVLEVVMRQYYATTLLSTQNKMFTDVTKANALLGSPEYQTNWREPGPAIVVIQTQPNYREALYLFRTCMRVLHQTAKASTIQPQAADDSGEWTCDACTYADNAAGTEACAMCGTLTRTREASHDDQAKLTPPLTERKHAVGGTLARLKRETEREETPQPLDSGQAQGQWNEWNFWRIEPPPVEDLEASADVTPSPEAPKESAGQAGTEDEQRSATLAADAARVEQLREEEKARERERGSNLGERHIRRMREVARMIVTRSELVQRKAPTGGDDCFQSLPNEVIAYIFTFVFHNHHDIANVHYTCRQWNEIAQDEHIYKQMTRRCFPGAYASLRTANRTPAQDETSPQGGWKSFYLTLLTESTTRDSGLACCGGCGAVWWRFDRWCSACQVALPCPLPPNLVPKALVTRRLPTPQASAKEHLGYYGRGW